MAGEVASRVKPGGGEAVVAFNTTLPEEYKVPEDQLVIPSNLARYGLSEVVNRLLSLEKPVPFDFLVDGEFLRTNVEDYVEAKKLSSEKVLKLEYVFALREPEQNKVDEVPDWISGLVPLQALPCNLFAAVSYDGTLRVYRAGQAQLIARLSDAALTGVGARASNNGSSCNMLAACKDGSVKCCSIRLGGSTAAAGSPAQAGGGSTASGPVSSLYAPGQLVHAVEAAAFSEDGTLASSAGWDHNVAVWNADPELFIAPDVSENGKEGAGVKRKAPGAEGKVPKFLLKEHTQVVTCLHFGAHARYPFTLMSSSWDCSLRTWDIAAASCVCNWNVARAVTSFSLSPRLPPQLVSSHEDGHVSLWDIRAGPHAVVQGALSLDAGTGLDLASAQTPHRRLAAQVAWCPLEDHRIASVGHDGHLFIIDPRSPKMPLASIRMGKPGPVPTKLLCLTWLGRDALVAGGSDGRVVQVSLGAGNATAVAVEAGA